MDQPIDFPLPLGRFKTGQSEVYAMASDRDSTFKIVVIGGKVRSASRSKADDQVALLDTDLPPWHGDSRGGVVSRDGRLIGVITGFKMKWSALHNAKLVCAPDKDFVESIVEVDRAHFASKPSAASATSQTGSDF